MSLGIVSRGQNLSAIACVYCIPREFDTKNHGTHWHECQVRGCRSAIYAAAERLLASRPNEYSVGSTTVEVSHRRNVPPAPVVYSANCHAVRAADAAPLLLAYQPSYRATLHPDQDGIAYA